MEELGKSKEPPPGRRGLSTRSFGLGGTVYRQAGTHRVESPVTD